jgi:PPP family 3-phenylpropionic acid transporter
MTGYAAESFGSTAFLVLSLGFALVRLFVSLILPTFKTSEETSVPQTRTGYRALLRPHLFWPLASWSISYATILALNSYLSLHLKQEGYDEKAISWLIAIGAFTEVLMFFAFRKFEHRLDLRAFIGISSGTAVLRWLLMASSPGLGALIILQASHGISYALGFVACLSFIKRNTTWAEAAEVQSFFNVMQQIAAVIFITAFGAAFDDWGAMTFLLSAAVAGLGCLIVIGAVYIWRETG